MASTDRGRDDSDLVGVLVENDELAVHLLLDDEPVLRGKARFPEPDLLLPRGLLAVSHVLPPFLLSFSAGVWYAVHGLIFNPISLYSPNREASRCFLLNQRDFCRTAL